ncbi:MBOAT family protein, partial [Salmonella enterica subsp. houtenae serovar 48:z4,z32:-]|nr:MBOAT family protein [Salmonella enterica subsp. arizonae]EEE1765958.1 MBOAT family protein [Salmonella enterica subsp. houtenae serovar 48:z4,z32:-]
FSIFINISILSYFKYFHLHLSEGVLSQYKWLSTFGMPLAISFFTFQQISIQVDSYLSRNININVTDYLYYILFFPKLISGPITRYSDLMPQSNEKRTSRASEILGGLSIFSVGLFKKVVVSSCFSNIADTGYSSVTSLTFFDSWGVSLAYTMQIYFDFSGYSDMAIGSALLLGIKLPINFNSPYKSKNIREFWDRWHISLSTWLRDYVYIPLGGSRHGNVKTYINIIITFIISGAWHGSTFNFILWGSMHGIATCISRAWTNYGMKMNNFLAWIVTFLFINFSWVPFRASSLEDTLHVFKSMIGINGVFFSQSLWQILSIIFEKQWISTGRTDLNGMLHIPMYSIVLIPIALLSCTCLQNSNYIAGVAGKEIKSPNIISAILCGIAFSLSIISMFGGATASQFIYANF